MTPAIQTRALSKRFGRLLAVDQLSLEVPAGQIYAFLGLNGAGKTTTIRMLLGMIKPTSGEAWVLGTRVHAGRTEPWAQVGHLVETPHAYPELTVRENLEAARRLHPGTPPAAIDIIIQRLGLEEVAGRRAAVLSHGNAQRLGLAKALLHTPRLVILDEPANGLDPAGIVEIRQLLHELSHEQGATVFLSSHILAEVTRLADRIGIIHAGRLIQEIDRQGLEQNRRRRLVVQARDLPAAAAALSAAGKSFELLPEASLALASPEACEYPDRLAAYLVSAGTPPTRLVVEEEDLEHYFLRLVNAGMDESDA